MDNPVWLENNRQRRSNHGVLRTLRYYWQRKDALLVPRGHTHEVLALLDCHSLPYELRDRTRLLPDVSFSCCANLHPHQEKAARAVLSRRFSVAQLPTGAGKTVLALYCVAQRAQPACVIVHTRELLYQWRDRAAEFLGLPHAEVGIVGDGNFTIGPRLTIALVQTLYKRAREVRDHVGHLIVDECHHAPARTFTDAVRAFDTRFMIGLSATPYRRDRMTPIIGYHIGPLVCRVDPRELQDAGRILGAELRVRETSFDYPYRDDYQGMLTVLAADEARNRLIAEDVAGFAAGAAGPALVVSDRKQHCEALARKVRDLGIDVALLTGDTPGEERQRIVHELSTGGIKVLVATMQLVGEGFDCDRLAGLFLTTPIKFPGRVLQVVGRVLRTSDGKEKPVVYDYVDRAGVLRSSFAARMQAYKQLGMPCLHDWRDTAPGRNGFYGR